MGYYNEPIIKNEIEQKLRLIKEDGGFGCISTNKKMNNPNKPHKSCARFTAEYLMLIAELHLQKISNECEELIKTYFTKRNIFFRTDDMITPMVPVMLETFYPPDPVKVELHVTPYYNKTSQQGLFLHFKACAEATSLPIILYNVPSRTGVNIFPATYKRLSEIDNIVACKEASGNFSQIVKISALCKDNLTIYSGNDDQITSSLALGEKGVISVLSNIFSEETHQICTSYFAGDTEKSDSLQLQYLELIEALFLDVNPIPVKQAMYCMTLLSFAQS